MTNNPYALLNITGKPSKQGETIVKNMQNALDILDANHPKSDGRNDGPMTAETKLWLRQLSEKNK